MNVRLFLLLVALVFLKDIRAGSTTEAEQRLRKAVDQATAVADASTSTAELMKKIRPLLEKNISFAAMTRRAIGPGWRQFTPDQQRKAVDLFSELIIRRYVGRFTIGEHPAITYKTATEPAPGRVEVPTLFKYKGSSYEVLYRLEQAEGWKITDIVVEGVSFIANYRTQFDAPFQKGGPQGVINALTSAVANPK